MGGWEGLSDVYVLCLLGESIGAEISLAELHR